MTQEYQEQYLSPSEHNHLLQFVLWFFAFVFFTITSVIFSLIIYLSANNEWDIAQHYSNSYIDFALHTFPFFLLFIIIPGLLLTIAIFKFTAVGRFLSFYRTIMIISFSIIFFSLLFFYTGISKVVNSSLKPYSFHELIIKNRNEIWQNPDFGLLSGEIGVIIDLDDFLLIDFNNKIWTIKSNGPKISNKSIIQPGNKIKLLGRKTDSNIFAAQEIRAYK